MNLSTILLIPNLLRFHAPAGLLLCYFPAIYGSLIANHNITNYYFLTLLFIGNFTSRSAGCIINDILDRKFDIKVERTKERVIASGKLTLNFVIIILIFLLIISLGVLLLLNKISIYLGFLAFIMICLYPIMKRITNFAQVFLGMTYNLGALIGYSSIAEEITIQALILYISTIFWTLGYDTIYAFMDIKDDKKIGLNSMAILLEHKKPKQWVMIFYIIFVLLLIVANNLNIYRYNYIDYGCGLTVLGLVIWQIFKLDITKSISCQKFFNLNILIGIFLAVYLTY